MFNNLWVSFRKAEKLKYIDFRRLYMASNRLHKLGTVKLKPTLPNKNSTDALVNTPCSQKQVKVIF